MTNQTQADLSGFPMTDQLEMFGEEEVRPGPKRYVPKPEHVRNALVSLERELKDQDPAEVASWYAERWVVNHREKLDYLCSRLAEVADPAEAETFRARIAPLLATFARRLGVNAA